MHNVISSHLKGEVWSEGERGSERWETAETASWFHGMEDEVADNRISKRLEDTSLI